MILLVVFRVHYLDRYREAITALDKLPGLRGAASIQKMRRTPGWLWAQFGDDVAWKVTSLKLSSSEIDDSIATRIDCMSDLQHIDLENTMISDQTVKSIETLDGLISLNLRRTRITKPPRLANLPNFVDLDLAFTEIKDIDTSNITSLESLDLRGTQITDDTLAAIKYLPKLRMLDIAGAPGKPSMISDYGLSEITQAKFPRLETIYLYDTRVSDEGVNRLQSSFPQLKIVR